MRLSGFSPKDRQAILNAQKHIENISQIMSEWEEASGTEAKGRAYIEYYKLRIKELENAD